MTDKIKARRLRLAGHCVRHGEKENAESASVELAGSLAQKKPLMPCIHYLFGNRAPLAPANSDLTTVGANNEQLSASTVVHTSASASYIQAPAVQHAI